MPIRIYALAKELKIDSKELVEVCAKAGIAGKGSALASLSDDEVAKVKSYLQGGSKPERTPSPATPAAASDSPPKSSSESDSQPSSTPLKSGGSPSKAPTPFSRDDYIAPAGTGKPRVISTKRPQKPKPETKSEPEPTEQTAAETKETGKPAAKKEPVVRVAAIPQAPEPPKPKKQDEPSPQKPIMTLPADAIRNAKSGSRAPLEQFTKQQDKGGGDRDVERSGKRPATSPTEPQPLTKQSSRDRRRGRAEEDDQRDKRLAAMSGTRVARQQKRRRSQGDDDDSDVRRKRRRLTRKGTNTAAPRKGRVIVTLPCTVRSLSEATGVPTAAIQRTLMQMGLMATINQEMDPETAEFVAAELDMEVDFKQAESLEDQLQTRFEAEGDDAADLVTRAPVITFLGHVDHGKTSLLDRVIGSDVVSGEAGGITQHIRAYKIERDSRSIAFVDTPGHEAFTEMRARGANVTDIAVLVIAADDGIMPQTEEAISHARAAGVPIVVALNKCDLPGADVNRVMQELSAHELLPSEWGGDVEVIKTSAITGEGIDDLLETLLLTADLHEYTANPSRVASGVCLEAEQEGNRGVVAKMIVKNGTLKVGDVLVCGRGYGRVKAMYDTLQPSKKLTEADPSTPVNLTGLNLAPEAGDMFYVLPDIAEAREIADRRSSHSRSESLSGRSVRVSFDEFQRRLEEGRLGESVEVTTLNLILRADVRGSIEAIQKELEKLHHPEVQINILQATVGGVTTADVTLADASNAVIIGFNVIPDEGARQAAEERGVEIRRYDIIYKVTEDIRALLEGKLRPEERVADLGRALVQKTFTISRVGTVAGCRVLAGTVERNCRIRVNRNGRGIGDYPLDSLKREKDDAKVVREGFECGIKLSGFNDLKEGDILEAYKIEEVARTLA